MKRYKRTDNLIFLFIFTSILIFVAGCQPVRQIENPYHAINWKRDRQYKSNLHTHTMVSDGWMNPHTVVEKYHEKGYQILAITDHNSVTYPWEDFSGLKVSGKTIKRIEDKTLKPQEEEIITTADLNFKNVRPSELGMIAIQGNELSSHHHMGSLFNDHNGTTTEDESLKATAAKNGVNILNHPGRYHETNPKQYSLEWYLDLYRRYPHLLGMEVYNCGNRFPHDDLLWDSVLTVIAPARPVWGFSNDDMHSMRDFGRNWNVFPLPEFNEQEVRQAMENGAFYFVYAPEGHDGAQPPVIESIKVNRGIIGINSAKHDSIAWINNGKTIKRGNKFRIKDTGEEINYIRAEIYGADYSVVCTQPFFIKPFEKKKK